VKVEIRLLLALDVFIKELRSPGVVIQSGLDLFAC
jgi:hypothetical protein